MEKYKNFKIEAENRKHNIVSDIVVPDKEAAGVYVLVIGESQNKKHMSAYGYGRKTTPWLDRESKRQPNFLLYRKAYSAHVQTVQALAYALTAKNQYNELAFEKSPSLIEVANIAGYDTVWISNQAQYGTFDTPSSIIALEAKQQYWNTVNSTDKNSYDLDVLKNLERISISNKMLIVIHLMGNHMVYDNRYPKNFIEFPPDDSVNSYDNSILNNDYVM